MSRVPDGPDLIRTNKRKPRSKSKARRRYNRLKRLAKTQRNENGEPVCYWCKCVVVIVLAPKPGRFPPNMATLDHLETKYDRPRHYMGMRKTVMACYRCNHERGNEATRARPIEELRARSQRQRAGDDVQRYENAG